MIDKREIECIEQTLEAFSEATVNLIQSVRRVLLLLNPPQVEKKNPQAEQSGDMCRKCGGLLVRTGTCKTCQSCGTNEGCG